MQVSDSEQFAGSREIRADGIRRVWKDLFLYSWHRLNDRKCLCWQITPDVVSVLLSGILHVSHKDAAMLLVKVRP